MMKKRNVFILTCVASVVITGFWWFLFSTNDADTRIERTAKGVIVKIEENPDTWGFKKDFSWRDPFANRKFSILSLSQEYQIDPLPVHMNYRVYDVVGISDWGIVIKTSAIEKLRE